MTEQISEIYRRIAPIREQIIKHEVYAVLEELEDLQIFMEFHIYAVWDFMSLLKALQRNLTCVSTPWFPVGNPVTRHLINEIVNGEESDVDQHGVSKSHFELYLDAMQESGANVDAIAHFIDSLKKDGDFQKAFDIAGTPAEARDFVNFTFSVIDENQPEIQAAVFTFGREDLIPNMFLSLVADISASAPQKTEIFKYYLERHIEVDGDHHSHLALDMTSQLCGQDKAKWEKAAVAVVQSLEMRKHLWDGAHKAIMARRMASTLS